jgi:hypothetical protein
MTITLEWEVNPADNQVLLSWESAMRMIGNGGPDWDIVPGVIGEPIVMPKTQGSKVVIVQSGRGVGMNYYPIPATPVWTGTPPLHGPSTMVERYVVPGPSHERVTSWSYTYFFPTYTPAPAPAAHNFHL